MAQPKTSIRNLFLIELGKQLIIHKALVSSPLYEPASPMKIEQITLKEQPSYLPSPIVPEENVYAAEVVNYQIEPQKIIAIREIGEELRPLQPHPKTEAITPPIVQHQYVTTWGKLNDIMNNPSIESIECPGPDKPIIVLKDGKQVQTPLALTNEEIKKLLEKMSSETKTKIQSGILKAETNNFAVTAVISEFVGSRFFVQKKQPLFH